MMKKVVIFMIMVGLQCCSPDRKFDPVKWHEQSDPAFPPDNRRFMLNDLLENHNLKGKGYSEIIKLLGTPDFHAGSKFGYYINVDYGTDIDPVNQKNLVFTIYCDSSVASVQVEELD